LGIIAQRAHNTQKVGTSKGFETPPRSLVMRCGGKRKKGGPGTEITHYRDELGRLRQLLTNI